MEGLVLIEFAIDDVELPDLVALRDKVLAFLASEPNARLNNFSYTKTSDGGP